MKNLITKIFILLSLTSILGCKTIGELQKEIESRPKYEKMYMPLEEMKQKFSRESALDYCKAYTSGVYSAAYQDAYSARPSARPNAQTATTFSCSESFNTITCKEKQQYDGAIERQDIRYQSKAENYAKSAKNSAFTVCMLEAGYVLKKVCVKNCPSQTKNNQLHLSNSSVHKYLETLSQYEYESLSDENKSNLQKAKEGNLRANYNLGLSFANGSSALKNLPLGINILESSAEKDHLSSQYALGTIYEKNKRYEKSADWYERAANLGHLESQFRFGWFNWKGEEKGATKDLTKAKYWFEKAAESGHARAQFMLGAINFKNGQSLEAYKWIHISEENGLADKYIKSSENLKNKLAQELTESQIENSKKVALVCIESSYKNCNF